MKMKELVLLGTIALISNAAMADAHIWHTIASSEGAWKARITMINEHGYFVTTDGDEVSTFSINPKAPKTIGFKYEEGADFDAAYTLTLTQDSTVKRFVSKACVFVVSAVGPGRADIRTLTYNGAKCDFGKVPGKGIDFQVG